MSEVDAEVHQRSLQGLGVLPRLLGWRKKKRPNWACAVVEKGLQ